MKIHAYLTAALLLMAASAQDKLSCGAAITIYDGINCQGNVLEAWTLNSNGHHVHMHNVYGSPDAPVALSVGWDKAANTLTCLGIADVECDRTLGEIEPAYDSQCISLEPGCDSGDCWQPFGRLYISQAVSTPAIGYEQCGFAANW